MTNPAVTSRSGATRSSVATSRKYSLPASDPTAIVRLSALKATLVRVPAPGSCSETSSSPEAGSSTITVSLRSTTSRDRRGRRPPAAGRRSSRSTRRSRGSRPPRPRRCRREPSPPEPLTSSRSPSGVTASPVGFPRHVDGARLLPGVGVPDDDAAAVGDRLGEVVGPLEHPAQGEPPVRGDGGVPDLAHAVGERLELAEEVAPLVEIEDARGVELRLVPLREHRPVPRSTADVGGHVQVHRPQHAARARSGRRRRPSRPGRRSTAGPTPARPARCRAPRRCVPPGFARTPASGRRGPPRPPRARPRPRARPGGRPPRRHTRRRDRPCRPVATARHGAGGRTPPPRSSRPWR